MANHPLPTLNQLQSGSSSLIRDNARLAGGSPTPAQNVPSQSVPFPNSNLTAAETEQLRLSVRNMALVRGIAVKQLSTSVEPIKTNPILVALQTFLNS